MQLLIRKDVTLLYKTCPYCDAHLDPGEICDCHQLAKDLAEFRELTATLDSRQMKITTQFVRALTKSNGGGQREH